MTPSQQTHHDRNQAKNARKLFERLVRKAETKAKASGNTVAEELEPLVAERSKYTDLSDYAPTPQE